MLSVQKFEALALLLPMRAFSPELMLKEEGDFIFASKVEVTEVPLRLSKDLLL